MKVTLEDGNTYETEQQVDVDDFIIIPGHPIMRVMSIEVEIIAPVQDKRLLYLAQQLAEYYPGHTIDHHLKVAKFLSRSSICHLKINKNKGRTL